MNSTHRRYEIRTQRDKCWQVDSRSSDKGNALASANGMAANRSIDGVIVVEEFFDTSRGRYQERTIFSYFPLEYEEFCNSAGRSSDCAPASPRSLTLYSKADGNHFTDIPPGAAIV